MKIRTLIVSILGIVLVAGVSPAQETVTLEQELKEPVSVESSPQELPTESSFTRAVKPPSVSVPRATRPRPATPRVTATRAPESPKVVQIFELKHASAVDISNLISRVFNIDVAVDSRLNRLIVNETREQIEDVGNLIQAMDIPGSETSMNREAHDFIYRIYMLEAPSGYEGMRPFSMILRRSSQVPSQDLLGHAESMGIRVSDFLISDEDNDQQNVDILIQGHAPSDESVREFTNRTSDQLRELKWDDDETFTNKIEAAQYTHLPEQMQKHIARLLGDEIRTVGYWFGNLSVPGLVEAPIGPWKLSLQLDTESDRMVQLQVEVEAVGEEEQIDEQTWRQQIDEILSNTLTVKIGKPIIIGYNRESYGTRKMGAMVIVPEADSL